jgi:lysophospholipid acyltransferase (LPLAT)-like uncharacterized protein
MMKSFLLVAGYAAIRLLALSYRFRVVGPPPRGGGEHGGYVLAIWHQNLFAGILAQNGRRHTVMISRSRDGDAVAYLCRRLGHHVVRGSSKKGSRDKGGKLAKDEMIEVLRSGMPGAITVDGPSGPVHEVKPGIVEMARLAGVPIVPYLAIPQRYWRFNSWDAFRLPKPFTRIDIHYGEPIAVCPKTCYAEFPQRQQEIAAALNAVEQAHDRGRRGATAH